MGIEMAVLWKNGTPSFEKVMDVMFNPETYSIDYKVVYQTTADANNRTERLHFSQVSARILTLELLFDSTNVWRDSSIASTASAIVGLPGAFSKSVTDATACIHELAQIDPSTGIPPIIAFSWGKFFFVGAIEALKETMTEFSAKGDPVKAEMSLTIKECFDNSPIVPPTASTDVAAAATGSLASSNEQNLETAVTAVAASAG